MTGMALIPLKGVAYQMDLAFDDMLGLNRGRDHFLNVLPAPTTL
jgi:hypothetical protein